METASPPPPALTPAGFGRELKGWVRHAPRGPVKVATLARRLQVSQSTVYAYLAGTTLPSSVVLDDLMDLLAVPAAERRRLATARDHLQERRRPRGAATDATGPGDRAGDREQPTRSDTDDDAPSPPTRLPTPRELPSAPAGFVGRTTELAALDALLTNDGTTAPPPIIVLSGTAGVGKTALALHWGHRVSEHFPDGSLYVDLRGFSPEEPRTPGSVLAAFLRSLGVRDQDLPDEDDERASRLRSLLAGRRLLLVIDNALDAEQVRPLLPGEPGCCVVVTSRRELPGLRVHHGVVTVSLQPLASSEGADLLLAHLPDDASVEKAQWLSDRCAGLPLALRLVAAQALDRSLDDLADDLIGHHGLDVLDIDDDASIRAVFSWSERRLAPECLDAFHLLGLQPFDSIEVGATAALLGTTPDRARRCLDSLTRAHLVQPTSSGRFTMHDLLRTHAREQALARLADDRRTAALTALVDHLAAGASHAMAFLQPANEGARTVPAGPPDVPLPTIRNAAQAQAWLHAEWQNLLRAIALTTRSGWPEHTGRLVSVLRSYLDQCGRHEDALVILSHALDAGRAAGDDVAEASALVSMGAAHLKLGQHDQARACYEEGLVVATRSGDLNARAGSHNNLGNLLERIGDYPAAIEHYERALPLARELGYQVGEATLLNNLGVAERCLGRFDESLDRCRQALDVFTAAGDIGGTARALGNVGETHLHRGELAEAHERLSEAWAAADSIGATSIATEVLNSLAECQLLRGHSAVALEHHERARLGAIETGDLYEQARALKGSGQALRATGRDDEAVQRLQGVMGDLPGARRPRGVPRARSARSRLSRTPAPDRAPARKRGAHRTGARPERWADGIRPRVRLSRRGDPAGRPG